MNPDAFLFTFDNDVSFTPSGCVYISADRCRPRSYALSENTCTAIQRCIHDSPILTLFSHFQSSLQTRLPCPPAFSHTCFAASFRHNRTIATEIESCSIFFIFESNERLSGGQLAEQQTDSEPDRFCDENRHTHTHTHTSKRIQITSSLELRLECI